MRVKFVDRWLNGRRPDLNTTRLVQSCLVAAFIFVTALLFAACGNTGSGGSDDDEEVDNTETNLVCTDNATHCVSTFSSFASTNYWIGNVCDVPITAHWCAVDEVTDDCDVFEDGQSQLLTEGDIILAFRQSFPDQSITWCGEPETPAPGDADDGSCQFACVGGSGGTLSSYSANACDALCDVECRLFGRTCARATFEDTSGGGGGGDSLLASSYYPFTVGDSWTSRTTRAVGGPTSTNRQEVLRRTVFDGQDAFETRYRYSTSGFPDTESLSYARFTATGDLEYLGGRSTSDFCGTLTTEFDPPLKGAPAQFELGDSFSTSSVYRTTGIPACTDSTTTIRLDSTTEFVAFERVTVPAGTYPDALRVRAEQTTTLTTSLGTTVTRAEVITWLVEDLGIVKTTFSGLSSNSCAAPRRPPCLNATTELLSASVTPAGD